MSPANRGIRGRKNRWTNLVILEMMTLIRVTQYLNPKMNPMNLASRVRTIRSKNQVIRVTQANLDRTTLMMIPESRATQAQKSPTMSLENLEIPSQSIQTTNLATQASLSFPQGPRARILSPGYLNPRRRK